MKYTGHFFERPGKTRKLIKALLSWPCRQFKGKGLLGLCTVMGMGIFLLWSPGMAGEKITVGFVEEVILLPWGVRLPARIDTGATTSSLDVRELSVKGQTAEFKLPEKYGGLQLRLPVVKWKTVRSAEARTERPVVEIELCFGPKRIRTQVNLNDRSKVKYPLLLGRNTLKHYFVVDCDRSHCTSPECPEEPSE
jgi:hypothetical protein